MAKNYRKKLYPDLPTEGGYEWGDSNPKVLRPIYNDSDDSENQSRLRSDARSASSQGSREVPDHEKEEVESDNEGSCLEKIGSHFYSILLVIFTVCLMFVVATFVRPEFIKMYKLKKESPILYNDNFLEMRKEFTSQSEMSWKILNNSLYRHIFSADGPEKPAVINLVGESEKVHKLVYRISSVLTRSHVSGQCEPFPHVHDDRTIDHMILSIEKFILEVKRKGSKCIWIPNLDEIPPSLGPFFHGLTDENTAKFKDIIYIFSLGIPYQSISKSGNVEADLVQVLSHVWKSEMGVERFEALISRLVVNVVWVR